MRAVGDDSRMGAVSAVVHSTGNANGPRAVEHSRWEVNGTRAVDHSSGVADGARAVECRGVVKEKRGSQMK